MPGVGPLINCPQLPSTGAHKLSGRPRHLDPVIDNLVDQLVKSRS